MPAIRTLIADDHPATREGIAALLAGDPEIEVVGTAADGREAVEKAAALGAEVVVMDIKMPELDGVEAAHRIKGRNPAAGIVILSSYVHSGYLRELLSDGRLGYAYLLKTATIEEIRRAILTAAHGGFLIDPQVGVQATDSIQLTVLTPRETDVLKAIARGLDNQGIGKQLEMQPGTVSMHISNIYSKLAVDLEPDLNPRVAVVLIYHGLLAAPTGP